MSSYMRTMIYLRNKEDLGQTIGYLRLERKGGYLLFSLVLTGLNMPEDSPIYAVYDNGNGQQRYRLGNTGRDECCEGRILLSQLPQRELENAIYGALIGTRENYLTGTADSRHELPQWQEEEVVQEQTVQEKARTEAEKPVLTAAQEQPMVESKPVNKAVQEIFEDDEMVWCKRINPTEISDFDMEEWYLAANSFLLQGYYNYHHLIYASDGNKYYLGVPGQYQRRELYMAKRFGFPYFKGKRSKKLCMGDFGYWLREIKKDVKE